MQPEQQYQTNPLLNPMPNAPVPGMPVAVNPGQPNDLGVAGHHTAQDADAIEAEWVHIVKRVMTQHRNDPYNQSRAMTLLREDYLKKRYGRIIEDEAA